MDNWNDLRICLALHRYGTMSAAASVLHANVATISRRIHRLSEEFGAPLFSKNGVIWEATPLALQLIRWAEQTEARMARLTSDAVDYSKCQVVLRCHEQFLHSIAIGVAAEAVLRSDKDAALSITVAKDRELPANLDLELTTEALERDGFGKVLIGSTKRGVWCAAAHHDVVSGWMDFGFENEQAKLQKALHHAYGAPLILTDMVANMPDLLRRLPLAAILPVDFSLARAGLQLMTDFPITEDDVYLFYPESQRNDLILKQVTQVLQAAFERRTYDLDGSTPKVTAAIRR